jgi:hypothetical protein
MADSRRYTQNMYYISINKIDVGEVFNDMLQYLGPVWLQHVKV